MGGDTAQILLKKSLRYYPEAIAINVPLIFIYRIVCYAESAGDVVIMATIGMKLFVNHSVNHS
jgi:hypothetical protein